MNIASIPLARKYARAYLNVHGNTVTKQDYEHLYHAYQVLKKERAIVVCCALPIFSLEQKKEHIAMLLTFFSLPHSLMGLIQLLLDAQRLMLLPMVLEYVCREYEKDHQLMRFDVYTSMAVSSDTKQALQQFLHAMVGKEILSTYIVDQTLIGGVRLQSRSYMWEYSIKSRLKNMLQTIRI